MAETSVNDPQPQANSHPFLTESKLYISNLPPHITDQQVAAPFTSAGCQQLRPRLHRGEDGDNATSPINGSIEFRLFANAEKALAILQDTTFPGNDISPPFHLSLSPFPPSSSHGTSSTLPPPSGLPRLVRQLPLSFSEYRGPYGAGASKLYELFRPYGPIASARITSRKEEDEVEGLVTFWKEEDAKRAEEDLHCADVEGRNIAVKVAPSVPPAHHHFSANAPVFVPSGGYSGYQAHPPFPQPTNYPHQTFSTPRRFSNSSHHSQASPPAVAGPFVHGPGQQVQFAPPGSGSHSGLIDPCNLFCKNLDPDIDSNGLFEKFRQFGQIVSARVMRDEMGRSRGFGFVSFQTADQAAYAMHTMNGAPVGPSGKQLVVRLHEPKQLRQEKLAARFAGNSSSRSSPTSFPPSYHSLSPGSLSPQGSHPSSPRMGYRDNGHPRGRSSGATSPTASEGGFSMVGGASPRGGYQNLGMTMGPGAGMQKTRRSSGSYYHAALAGQLALPLTYDELNSIAPTVRREVLAGEMMRRVRELDISTLLGSSTISEKEVKDKELDSVVDTLINLQLSEVVDTLHDPAKLAERVKGILDPHSLDEAQQEGPSEEGEDEDEIPQAASAPEHPSTPVSMVDSTPARTESPSGSVTLPPPVAAPTAGAMSGTATQPQSERGKLLTAVLKLDAVSLGLAGEDEAARREKAEALTDLLMSLSKRERAMCVFNGDVLRGKVQEALAVLDAAAGDDNDEAEPGNTVNHPATPAGTRGPSAVSSPGGGAPSTPPSSTYMPISVGAVKESTKGKAPEKGRAKENAAYTLATLATIPATQIITTLRADIVLAREVGAFARLAVDSKDANGMPRDIHNAKEDTEDGAVEKAKETDAFVDGLMTSFPNVANRKQAVGDRIFKCLKAANPKMKGVPKVIISLLDKEDLRALAHLEASYPAVLYEKALLVQAQNTVKK